jgi:protoporphyrinogen oxidase
LEFLTFPPLSLWNKFRLALTIIYCSRINDWKRLEEVPVEDWLIKVSGKGTYEKMWKPLLLAKLGENYKRVSAVFIWSYIKRLYSARDTSAQKESMGYVSGGYKTVFERLAAIITNSGGQIHSQTPVKRIAITEDQKIKLESSIGEEVYDKVIFTSPVNVLEKIATPEVIEIQNTGKDVEYSGVICMVLVTNEPLIPYYTLNIADTEIPFTGVIGMTSVVSTDEMAGYHVTYLPKYVHSEDPLLSASDEEIKKLFYPGLKKMFPKFKPEHARSIHINRASKVQPLQVLNFSKIVPKVHMCHQNFFVLNTAQFVNNTLNNNTVIQAVDKFVADYEADFA